ncbi:S phase cyclin A-associated protein in the endoplasmic reticulum-like [Salvia splendens]|nr:S phase cyclin A-associated protein in the endoplasmic reticulum-like [Salvia splendens]XP_042050230.1 S phase cyclin A-associated protein in the endoplasmic reticulum-like [Salvia splendens]
MASDYGGLYRPHSTHILHSHTVSQPQCVGHEQGRLHHHHLQHDQHGLSARLNSHPQPQFHIHPHPHPHPLSSAQSHDLHWVIQREIEEEMLRHEIIMYKILTRRALEAELRRDLMMVETFLRRGHNVLPLAETMAEERFLDERSTLLMQRHMLNDMCEGGRSESLPFQRASIDERMGRDSMAKESEVKHVLEVRNKKNEIILEAKPVENITGAKRANPGSGTSAQSDGNLKKQKRVKEEWSCTLCQVIATSEHTLNEHLKGKRHQTKVAALKANKSMIGLCTKPIQSSGTSNQVIEVKLTPTPLSFGKPGSETYGLLPLQGNPNPDNLKKEESVVTPKGKQKGEDKKETYKFWCEMCQVGVLTEKVMKMHQQGKKHKRRLLQTK